MSLGKDIQRAESKIKAMEDQAKASDAIAAEHVSVIASLKSEIETAKADGAAAMVAIKAEHEKAVGEISAQAKASGEECVRLVAELGATKSELEEAKAKLANPAFAEASAKGEAKAIEASPEPAAGAKQSLFDQYCAIEDPGARTKFWNEHEKELRAEAAIMFKK